MTERPNLPSILDAVSLVSNTLRASGISHVFIGGIALAAWGGSRDSSF